MLNTIFALSIISYSLYIACEEVYNIINRPKIKARIDKETNEWFDTHLCEYHKKVWGCKSYERPVA